MTIDEDVVRSGAESLPDVNASIKLSGAAQEIYEAIAGEPTPEEMEKPLIQRIFPTGFKYELKELFKLAWPIILTLFLNILISPVSLAFSGHLGKLELDSVAMAISIANVIGTSIAVGMISACDTFFAQSFGSSNKKQVGVYLQTAIIVASLTCLIAWALIFNTNYILLKLGQNPDVARMSEEYLYIFMPAIYFMFIYQLLAKYLQVQHIVIPSVVIGVVCNGINAGLQYMFVYALDFGYKGSAIGQGITYLLLAVATTLFIIISGSHKETWPGWSRAAFLDWGDFMKLGMSSLFMICLEWWAFEVATFLMGILGETELGASSIIFQLWNLYGSVPIGIGAACSIKVGRYLGAKNPEGAVTAARTAIVVSWVVAIIAAVIVLTLREQLPLLFSNDPDVVALTVDLLPILAIFAFFGANKWICVGVVRGTGRQVIGGVVAFVSYFIFAMPIGIPLMFLTSLRAAGFWWGLNIGLILAALCFLFIVFRTDFHKEAEKAQLRAKIQETVKQVEERSTPACEEKRGLLSPAFNTPGKKEQSRNGTYGTLPQERESSLPSYMLSDSGEEPSVAHKIWKRLLLKRLSAVVICFAILLFGILCRFYLFIPPTFNTYEWRNITISS